MKCIKILTDSDFGMLPVKFNNPRIRFGARGIIFNEDNNIAIVHKRNKNEYKLVGGGLKEGESPESTFLREVHEESGAIIDNINCIGEIREYKSQDNFKQISYLFTANVISVDQTEYTEDEIDDGAELLWLPISEAMEKIKNSEANLLASKHEGSMSVYHSKFIVRRDYEILKYYENQYLNNMNNINKKM